MTQDKSKVIFVWCVMFAHIDVSPGMTHFNDAIKSKNWVK